MAGKQGIAAAKIMRSNPYHGGNKPMIETYPQEPGTMGGYLNSYLDYMRMLNRTPKAVKSCSKSITYFLRWAHERDLSRPDQITYSVLQSYQRWLWRYRKKADNKPLAVSSQRGRLGSVKSFFSWLCREHIIEANPASDLELPRAEKRLPGDALTIVEVEMLMSEPDISDPLGIRDRAILELLYSTGIRRTEIAKIELAELNRNKRILWVHGKGNKDRVVPVGKRALAWVEKYIDDVRPLLVVNPDEKTLFITGYGEAFNEESLGRAVRTYMLKAGITHQPMGCHLLRHTCATHMLEGGADIRYIQELLGHSKLDTTAIYTQVTIEKLKEIHGKTHPAESRKSD